MNSGDRKRSAMGSTLIMDDRWPRGVEGLPKLRKLEGLAINVVLNKAIHQIAILKALLPPPETDGREEYQHISARMSTLHRLKPPEDLESEQTLHLKQVQRWRTFAQYVLEETAQEISFQRSFNILKKILLFQNLHHYDNFSLKKENENLNVQIHDLKDKINEVKKNSQLSLIYLSKMSESCLEQASVTVWAQAETISRNTDVNLQAQKDQNKYRLRSREEEISDFTEKNMSDMEKETVIHSEITSHLNSMIGSLQKKLEYWTNKYTEEVDNLDITLLQLRSKVEEQQEKLGTIKQQFTEKKDITDVLQQEADERDREAELKLRQIKAATIIQQWWRRILFKRVILNKKLNKTNAMPTSKNKKKASRAKKKK